MTSKLQGRRSLLQMSNTSKAQIHRGTGYQWYQGIRGSTWQKPLFPSHQNSCPNKHLGTFQILTNSKQKQSFVKFSVISFKSALKDPNKNGNTFEPWVLDGYDVDNSCNTQSSRLGDKCREQLGGPSIEPFLKQQPFAPENCIWRTLEDKHARLALRPLLWLKTPKLTLLGKKNEFLRSSQMSGLHILKWLLLAYCFVNLMDMTNLPSNVWPMSLSSTKARFGSSLKKKQKHSWPAR